MLVSARTRLNKPDFVKAIYIIKTLLLGIAVHCLLIMAVFEVHFSNPVDFGVPPVLSLSKRVVLIVPDGVRVLYNTTGNVTPYLDYIRKNIGCYGESYYGASVQPRPVHIQTLAGIFEDPTVFFNAWKSGDVNFDKISLRTNTWTWTTPQITPLFSRDTLPSITPKDSDMWKFNELMAFLDKYKHSKEIEEPQSIFLLHLLGADTAGRGFKPESREEYIENLKIVDQSIAQLVNKFSQIFNDKETTYIFTSDYGMTNWELLERPLGAKAYTPFLAWGAGIKKPAYNPFLKPDTDFDFIHADIGPLISNLLGIAFPVPVLPGESPYKCFDVSENHLGMMLMQNVAQLQLIYKYRLSRITTRKIKFEQEFMGILTSLIDEKVEDWFGHLKTFKRKQDFKGFMTASSDVISHLSAGIYHYHINYRAVVLTLVSFGFLIWLIHLLITTVDWDHVLRVTSVRVNFFFMPVFCTILNISSMELCAFMIYAGYPFTYIMYMLFPPFMYVSLMWETKKYLVFLYIFIASCKERMAHCIKTAILSIISCSLIIAGFKYNPCWFSCLIILQIYWLQISPEYSVYMGVESNYRFSTEKIRWILMNSLLAVYPALHYYMSPSFVITYRYHLLIFGSFVWLVVNSHLSKLIQRVFPTTKFISFCYKAQLTVFFLSLIFKLLVDIGIISSTSSLKVYAWILSGVPMIFIPFVPRHQLTRLTAIILGLASYYLLTSTRMELLFMATFIIVLFMWLRVETRSYPNEFKKGIAERSHFRRLSVRQYDLTVSTDNIRFASQYICFLIVGFVGAGNEMNVNFFDSLSTRCFLTASNPSTEATLIILKMIIPLLVVTCFFRGVIVTARQNFLCIYSYVMFVADCLFLYFMLTIKSTGSWLEIGSSISHCVVMGMFIILILLVYGISHLFTDVYVHKMVITSTLKCLKMYDFCARRNLLFDEDDDIDVIVVD